MAKTEFAIIDLGKNGKGFSVYVNRTWETQSLAEAELASLLKYHEPDSEWRQRLIVHEHKPLEPIPNKGAHKVLSPDQELFTCVSKEKLLNAKSVGYITGPIIAWPIINFEHNVDVFPVLVKFIAKKTQTKINRRASGIEKYKRYIDKLYISDIISKKEI